LAKSFSELVPFMGQSELRQFGSDTSPPSERAPTAKRIADKMPINFKYLGLISLVLPNASIIHLRRNPVDTCLSVSPSYSGVGAGTMIFCELGRYYRAYTELMEHRHRVLPAGAILDVCYEDLVADFEPQARRILAHCGREWDERCLAFHKTERPVRTASAVQVRQPIYRNSLGRRRGLRAMARTIDAGARKRCEQSPIGSGLPLPFRDELGAGEPQFVAWIRRNA
jgi:Sulfotransferase family